MNDQIAWNNITTTMACSTVERKMKEGGGDNDDDNKVIILPLRQEEDPTPPRTRSSSSKSKRRSSDSAPTLSCLMNNCRWDSESSLSNANHRNTNGDVACAAPTNDNTKRNAHHRRIRSDPNILLQEAATAATATLSRGGATAAAAAAAEISTSLSFDRWRTMLDNMNDDLLGTSIAIRHGEDQWQQPVPVPPPTHSMTPPFQQHQQLEQQFHRRRRCSESNMDIGSKRWESECISAAAAAAAAADSLDKIFAATTTTTTPSTPNHHHKRRHQRHQSVPNISISSHVGGCIQDLRWESESINNNSSHGGCCGGNSVDVRLDDRNPRNSQLDTITEKGAATTTTTTGNNNNNRQRCGSISSLPPVLPIRKDDDVVVDNRDDGDHHDCGEVVPPSTSPSSSFLIGKSISITTSIEEVATTTCITTKLCKDVSPALMLRKLCNSNNNSVSPINTNADDDDDHIDIEDDFEYLGDDTNYNDINDYSNDNCDNDNDEVQVVSGHDFYWTYEDDGDYNSESNNACVDFIVALNDNTSEDGVGNAVVKDKNTLCGNASPEKKNDIKGDMCCALLMNAPKRSILKATY